VGVSIECGLLPEDLAASAKIGVWHKDDIPILRPDDNNTISLPKSSGFLINLTKEASADGLLYHSSLNRYTITLFQLLLPANVLRIRNRQK
jgi:hypothetical protein